jgi:hypothetical protein
MAKKKKIIRSNEERIVRVWDIEQIKDLMSRRTIYETNGEREEELGGKMFVEHEYMGHEPIFQ